MVLGSGVFFNSLAMNDDTIAGEAVRSLSLRSAAAASPSAASRVSVVSVGSSSGGSGSNSASAYGAMSVQSFCQDLLNGNSGDIAPAEEVGSGGSSVGSLSLDAKCGQVCLDNGGVCINNKCKTQ